MAGLGRRSHYRKHLTDAVLHDFPEPAEGECIAKVVATRGSNQFDIIVASSPDTPQLAILPTKFNKLVWLKRNDFVIVQTGNDDDDGGGGVRYMITHILYSDQVRHLKSKKLWPTEKEFSTASDREEQEAKWTSGEEEDDDDENEEEDDGIVYNTGYDDEFFINTNRLSALKIQESESESSSDED